MRRTLTLSSIVLRSMHVDCFGPYPWLAMGYHDFMMTGNLGLDGPRFQAQEAWTTVTTELLLKEEFELRGITMETLQHVFPLHQAPPPPATLAPAQGRPSPPAPAQGPRSPPAPGTPLMPNSPREAHVVIDLPDIPDLVVTSSGDEGHQGEEDDPEEDQDIDEAVVEQQ